MRRKWLNPYTVNYITYSGHGITFNGDAIAVFTEYQKVGEKELIQVFRFINFSHWARAFATVKNTLSIFNLSMCRVHIDKKTE